MAKQDTIPRCFMERRSFLATNFPKLLTERDRIGAKTGWGRRSRDILETVLAVLADEDVFDPLDLEPLSTSVGPETLEAVYEPSNNGIRGEFEYHGYKVILVDDNQVILEST